MGKSNHNLLLSIAIPTRNRAKLLEKALLKICEQSLLFKDDIELIISDNASTDNTQQVVNTFISKYSTLKIISFIQKQDTGYFGNFRKVRELSKGKYIWILSDDDHVGFNVISVILRILKSNEDLGLIFLDTEKDCLFESSSENTIIGIQETFLSLFKRRGYKMTLISSVIFLNRKENDNQLTARFKNNSFFAFILLLDSTQYYDKTITIYGKTLTKNLGKVSFNVYNSWIEDMSYCINYMHEIKIPQETINNFVNEFLIKIVKFHYLNSRLNNFQVKNKEELRAIEKRLKKYYGHYSLFNSALEKYFYKNKLTIYILVYKYKILKKINKIINNLLDD